jgi:hypothetical protein
LSKNRKYTKDEEILSFRLHTSSLTTKLRAVEARKKVWLTHPAGRIQASRRWCLEGSGGRADGTGFDGIRLDLMGFDGI